MILKYKIYVVLTTLLVILLPQSCTQKSKDGVSEYLKPYKMAQQAQDYQTAVGYLVKIASEDSSANPWVYDSLAFYHYFYLITPGVVRNAHVPKYFAQLGLELNPENVFLSEIKAKLDLEEQKIEIAQASFERLWAKTKDYTYLWILNYVDAMDAKGRLSADSVITQVLGDPEAENKTVRLEFPQERVRESVPAKAAFLYLRASFLLDQNKMAPAAELLNQALKLAPEFYGAKRLIYMMQQGGK